MKIIKREKYINKIYKFKNKPIIKVITGQRRVGKSFILKNIINDLLKNSVSRNNIIYINKEDLQFDDIIGYKELDRYLKEQNKKTNKAQKIYILIDEVQEIKEFEKTVRSYGLDGKFDIYITGSNSEIISSEISSLLGGRYAETYVSPLDYNEFLKFSDLQNNEENLAKYIKYGGMPFIHHSELNDDLVYTYTKNIYNTILLKDVIKRYEIRNINFLERLVIFLCNNLSYPLSANSISKYMKNERMKIAPSVILDYLNGLRSCYFVHEVKKFDLKGKRVFKQNSKYYLNDIGIRNAIVGYDESSINQMIENVVFLHLQGQEYDVYTGILGENEIDFVAMKGDLIKYIQVALTVQNKETKEREFGNLAKIEDNYEKIVVTADPLVKNYRGIKHIKLADFLSSEI